MSACELHLLLCKINEYEPGLVDMIRKLVSMVYYVGKGELQFGGPISSMGGKVTVSDVILICKGSNGIIFGCVDELTKVSTITDIFNKHKTDMNSYKDCDLYLTDGCGKPGIKNLILRNKIDGVVKQYGMKYKPITRINIVRNGALEFDIKCFDKKEILLDSKKNSTRTFNLMSQLELEQSMCGLDRYGRPPPPQDRKLYRFNYTEYKWQEDTYYEQSYNEQPYYNTIMSIQQSIGRGLSTEPPILLPGICSVSDCYDNGNGVSSCYGNCNKPFCSFHMPGDQCSDCRM
jgi:hypothetical protein